MKEQRYEAGFYKENKFKNNLATVNDMTVGKREKFGTRKMSGTGAVPLKVRNRVSSLFNDNTGIGLILARFNSFFDGTEPGFCL